MGAVARVGRLAAQTVTLDPLTGTCPTCDADVGETCHTAGGQPCPPHAARKGVVRDGLHDAVHRFCTILLDEFAVLHPGALTRDDVAAAIEAALTRYDYGGHS